MRKQEEEQFKRLDGSLDKVAWVKAHRFPEDTIADWNRDRGIRTSDHDYNSKKNFKITNKELFMNCRCKVCNFSNAGLHDNGLLRIKKKFRAMYFDVRKDILCEYCYHPSKSFNEQNEKTKVNMTDVGLMEIENAKLEFKNKESKSIDQN